MRTLDPQIYMADTQYRKQFAEDQRTPEQLEADIERWSKHYSELAKLRPTKTPPVMRPVIERTTGRIFSCADDAAAFFRLGCIKTGILKGKTTKGGLKFEHLD